MHSDLGNYLKTLLLSSNSHFLIPQGETKAERKKSPRDVGAPLLAELLRNNNILTKEDLSSNLRRLFHCDCLPILEKRGGSRRLQRSRRRFCFELRFGFKAADNFRAYLDLAEGAMDMVARGLHPLIELEGEEEKGKK